MMMKRPVSGRSSRFARGAYCVQRGDQTGRPRTGIESLDLLRCETHWTGRHIVHRIFVVGLRCFSASRRTRQLAHDGRVQASLAVGVECVLADTAGRGCGGQQGTLQRLAADVVEREDPRLLRRQLAARRQSRQRGTLQQLGRWSRWLIHVRWWHSARWKGSGMAVLLARVLVMIAVVT